MRGLLRPALATAATVLCLPSVATAATVTASPPGDVAAEKPFTVVVDGVADVPSRLDVGFASVADGCRSASTGLEFIDGEAVSGPFRVERLAQTPDRGVQLLCAYLSGDGFERFATAAVQFTARDPRASLTIAAPAVLPLNGSLSVSVSGVSEASRFLVVDLARPGERCDKRDPGLFERLTAAAPFSFGFITQLDRFGTWKLCAQVQASISFEPTDQRFERTVRVSVTCTRATRALSRARDRWRSRSRAFALAGRPPDGRLRRLGEATSGRGRASRPPVVPGCGEREAPRVHLPGSRRPPTLGRSCSTPSPRSSRPPSPMSAATGR